MTMALVMLSLHGGPAFARLKGIDCRNLDDSLLAQIN